MTEATRPQPRSAPVEQPFAHDVEDELLFEPLALLAELTKKAAEGRPEVLPKRLPLGSLKVAAALFQPRRMDARHIENLVKALNNKGTLEDLERVLVLQAGPEAYLMDGHHRLAAYERAGREDIPVRYFEGELKEAVLEAGKANSRAKLPMSNRERQEYAWRLVRIGGFSKRGIVEASGVSHRQVGIMREVSRALGSRAYDTRTWYGALSLYRNGYKGLLSDEQLEAWFEQQANEWADRMSKTFGSKLSNNIELAARTLEIYFGRRMPELAVQLKDHIPEVSDEDEYDFC